MDLKRVITLERAEKRKITEILASNDLTTAEGDELFSYIDAKLQEAFNWGFSMKDD